MLRPTKTQRDAPSQIGTLIHSLQLNSCGYLLRDDMSVSHSGEAFQQIEGLKIG
jgi:hypothetical protein